MKKGFTLIQMVLVLLMITILTVASVFSANNSVRRTSIDATVMTLQVFQADMEAIIEDIGVLEIDSTEVAAVQRGMVLQYLDMIEATYTHVYFDRATLDITPSQFRINTVDAKDAWGSSFTFIYNTDASKGPVGTCIFASPGPNMILESEKYAEGEFGDDILIFAKPTVS